MGPHLLVYLRLPWLLHSSCLVFESGLLVPLLLWLVTAEDILSHLLTEISPSETHSTAVTAPLMSHSSFDHAGFQVCIVCHQQRAL